MVPVAFVMGSAFMGAHVGRRATDVLTGHHLEAPKGIALVGSIDSAKGSGEIIADQGSGVALYGWAAFVSGSPLRELQVFVDGKAVATIKGFTSRPDVADAYGRSDFGLSGWQTRFLADSIAPGRHKLTVRATAANEASADLPSAVLVVR